MQRQFLPETSCLNSLTYLKRFLKLMIRQYIDKKSKTITLFNEGNIITSQTVVFRMALQLKYITDTKTQLIFLS